METLREALSDIAIFIMVVVGAVVVDGMLHLIGRPDWGRYFGYWGTLLIIASFAHSARKREMITTGPVYIFLRFHEFFAWLGSMMILVHGGIHFNALLPWLATSAMLLTVASGLTGKFLLKKSKVMSANKKKVLLKEGMSADQVEDKLYWDSMVVTMIRKWRVIHIPITAIFGVLALLHVISVLIYWRWGL